MKSSAAFSSSSPSSSIWFSPSLSATRNPRCDLGFRICVSGAVLRWSSDVALLVGVHSVELCLWGCSVVWWFGDSVKTSWDNGLWGPRGHCLAMRPRLQSWRRDVSHARSRYTAEEGASTADKKTKQSKKVKIEHVLMFSVVFLVRYAEAEGIPTLISNKLKLPGKMTAVLVFFFMAVKFLYKALKETKDIEGVLDYFRKIVKQGAPPVEDKDGAAKP